MIIEYDDGVGLLDPAGIRQGTSSPLFVHYGYVRHSGGLKANQAHLVLQHIVTYVAVTDRWPGSFQQVYSSLRWLSSSRWSQQSFPCSGSAWAALRWGSLLWCSSPTTVRFSDRVRLPEPLMMAIT